MKFRILNAFLDLGLSSELPRETNQDQLLAEPMRIGPPVTRKAEASQGPAGTIKRAGCYFQGLILGEAGREVGDGFSFS